MTVTALVSSGRAYRILEEAGKNNIQRLKDGSFKVTFVMPEDDWLYGYLMSYGPHIRVLEPERVRKRLIRELTNSLDNYTED